MSDRDPPNPPPMKLADILTVIRKTQPHGADGDRASGAGLSAPLEAGEARCADVSEDASACGQAEHPTGTQLVKEGRLSYVDTPRGLGNSGDLDLVARILADVTILSKIKEVDGKTALALHPKFIVSPDGKIYLDDECIGRSQSVFRAIDRHRVASLLDVENAHQPGMLQLVATHRDRGVEYVELVLPPEQDELGEHGGPAAEHFRRICIGNFGACWDGPGGDEIEHAELFQLLQRWARATCN